MRSILALSLLVFATSLRGSPVLWTMDASFRDGGTATGFFVFDADQPVQVLEPITDWDINTSGGDTSTFFPFDFNPADSTAFLDLLNGEVTFRSDATFPNNLPPPDNIDEHLFLSFAPITHLTDSGGAVPIWFGDECFNCDPAREISAGSLTGSPVPEPRLAYAVALLAVLLLIQQRRRRPHAEPRS